MATSLMTPNEKSIRSRWVREALGGSPPFSFVYGGVPSGELAGGWKTTRSSRTVDGIGIVHTILSQDPGTGLAVAMELTEFDDNAAVEWLIHLSNTGDRDTPLIECIKAVNAVVPGAADARPVLWYSKGSSSLMDDFALQRQDITDKAGVTLASCSSAEYLPFFNVDAGPGGVIGGLGWSGHWTATFSRAADGPVLISAGMAKSRLLLHPGERIRVPSVLLIFWEGDRLRAHNMLRRHIVAHHLPRPGGKEVEAPICDSTWGGMKTGNHLKSIQFIKDNHLDYDIYWMDAGWYGPDHETEEYQNFYTEDWAYHMGFWRANRTMHPRGIAPISDAVHDAGMKLLLWIAPFVGAEGSPWQEEHPEWFEEKICWGENGIGLNSKKARIRRMVFRGPETVRWLAERVCAVMEENGADHYREDIGMPSGGEDEPDRQGMSECKAMEFFYLYWDELLRRRPSMLIDNCLGGGRRIDLETIGRSLVLHRSDYNCDPAASPVASQSMTWALAHWVPLVGGGVPAAPGNTYNFRSGLSGGMAFSLFHPCGFGGAPTEVAPGYPVEWHREMLSQFRRTRRFFKGDFYPLTGCTLSEEDWTALQFDCPDDGDGMVLAFRRKDSPYPVAELALHALDPSTSYQVENADTGEKTSHSGAELLRGLTIPIAARAESRLLFYKRI
jgi:alpha-galactosidase